MQNQIPFGVPNQNMYYPTPIPNTNIYDQRLNELEQKINLIENRINNIEKKLNINSKNMPYDYQTSMYMM